MMYISLLRSFIRLVQHTVSPESSPQLNVTQYSSYSECSLTIVGLLFLRILFLSLTLITAFPSSRKLCRQSYALLWITSFISTIAAQLSCRYEALSCELGRFVLSQI